MTRTTTETRPRPAERGRRTAPAPGTSPTPSAGERTRELLLVAAAHLFARHGIEEVPLRDIAQRAGQRNASAVQYHFRGRWDLVTGILARHETTVRGWSAVEEQSVRGIVHSLVALLRPELSTDEGRDFLRIVFELMARYPGRWEEATGTGDVGGRAAFDRVVTRLTTLLDELPRPVARARAVAMTQFVTYQFAERARLVDETDRRGLREELFVAELETLAVAMLTAPPSEPPTPAGRTAPHRTRSPRKVT